MITKGLRFLITDLSALPKINLCQTEVCLENQNEIGTVLCDKIKANVFFEKWCQHNITFSAGTCNLILGLVDRNFRERSH